MENDKRQDSTNESDDLGTSEIESSDNENPGSTNAADPGGDVIIIK